MPVALSLQVLSNAGAVPTGATIDDPISATRLYINLILSPSFPSCPSSGDILTGSLHAIPSDVPVTLENVFQDAHKYGVCAL